MVNEELYKILNHNSDEYYNITLRKLKLESKQNYKELKSLDRWYYSLKYCTPATEELYNNQLNLLNQNKTNIDDRFETLRVYFREQMNLRDSAYL